MTAQDILELAAFHAALDDQHVAAMEAEYGQAIPLADYSLDWLHAQYRARGDERQESHWYITQPTGSFVRRLGGQW